VAVLRQGMLAGRLGADTFVARIDAAYRAKTHDELATVTQDLPRPRRIWQTLLERVAPAPPSLVPPAMAAGERRVLGRGNSCDYVIADRTVSTRHAELARLDDGWLITDLGSRNGTRVNGWLVTEQHLHAGDTLTLGAASYVFEPAG